MFVLSIRINEKTLKFDNIRLAKKEFHKSKQSFSLDLVNIYQIVVSDKLSIVTILFSILLVTKKGKIVKPLCIILLQMSGYIKYLYNGGKNMSFITKNDKCMDKYNEIWDKIKERLNIKFYSMPVYNEKYIKSKVREFNGVIKTNFLSVEIKNENVYYSCTASITIDSVMRMKKIIIHKFI